MKMVYAHFPINVACDKTPGSKANNKIEIRNYLGEKVRINPSYTHPSSFIYPIRIYPPSTLREPWTQLSCFPSSEREPLQTLNPKPIRCRPVLKPRL